MNDQTPITQAEMFELLEPIYQIIGGVGALVTVAFALWLVIFPFIRKKIR